LAPDASNVQEPGIGLVTNTPGDEELNDISLTASGGERIVYSTIGAGNFDVYAFTTSAGPLPPPTSPLQPITGTFQVINAGPGDQTNPHVSGDIAVYTSTDATSEVRYYDFATNTDHLVPTGGFAAFLSDVSNGHIVYTQVGLGGSQIGEFNVADSTTTLIGTSNQVSNPTVSTDGSVAYEDRGFNPDPAASEIVVTDITQGAASSVRITNDAMKDINPQISADGNHVVYQKGDTTGVNNDVWVSDTIAPGVWTSTDITATLAGEHVTPDISGDGRFVTWASTADGDYDIYVWDRLNPSATTHFDLPGVQRNPSITDDGKYISFESNHDGLQFDVVLANNPLHDDFAVI
jgi:Tol biopolymer transport system component